MRAIGFDLHRLQHGGRGSAGSQPAKFVLERLAGALHAALHFVDVETRRGHNPLLSLKIVAALVGADPGSDAANAS